MNDRDYIEKEFLSILYFKTEIGFSNLQIKPSYLSIKEHEMFFDAMKKSYSKFKLIDDTYILDNVPANVIDIFTEIVGEQYLPLNDFEKRYENIQRSILDNYKKKVISDYSKQLNEGKLTTNDYLTKMAKINEVDVKTDAKFLTLTELNENIDDEKVRICLSNFPKLDNILQLVESDFLIIGAGTGTGKSGLLLNFMNDLMEKYQCIYLNLEMSKSGIYKRMIAINADVPTRCIGHESDYQKTLVALAKKKIVESMVIVNHELSFLEDIENFIKTFKNPTKRHVVLFIDHIGLVRTKASFKSLYEQRTEVMQRLRGLALQLNCTIIGASQLNRSSENNKDLTLSALKDSGEVANSASRIILLSREEGYSNECLEPRMVLDIAKNRDCMNGTITCEYLKTKQIFKEL